MPGWLVEVEVEDEDEDEDGSLLYAAYIVDASKAEELVRATLKVEISTIVRAIEQIEDDALRDLEVNTGAIKGPM